MEFYAKPLKLQILITLLVIHKKARPEKSSQLIQCRFSQFSIENTTFNLQFGICICQTKSVINPNQWRGENDKEFRDFGMQCYVQHN